MKDLTIFDSSKFLYKFILVCLIGLFANLLLTSCATYYHQDEKRAGGVFHFNMVKLGGVRQAVMIRGTKASNPVLVYLHGGPGFPMLPFEPNEESMRRLEREFTIVYWEQRGTGKSFSRRLNKENMTVDHFVEDTRQLIEYVQRKLNTDKVFLWGHSWGSNVGALFAARYPEYLHAYVSTGQSVNPFQNERLAYQYVLEKAQEENNRNALRELARIDTLTENYRLKDALTVRKWVYRYGGIVSEMENARPYVDIAEIQTMLTSRFYSLEDRYNLLRNPYFSAEMLWENLKGIDLEKQAAQIDVPVFFLVGRHDIIVSHVLANRYFQNLKAPQGKSLVWFEQSAHRPFAEEKEKFLEIMKGVVLNEVLPGALTRN